MASSVFFRFKSSKEPSRVTFDGTGISVFELKRQIITGQRLGDGTDFELVLSSDDSDEVFDDDTTIIPRSTTVIAKRLPATKPGRGGAARYVSGKMPVNAKNSHRSENAFKANGNSSSTKSSTTYTSVSELQTEEERMAAVLKMGADHWEQQQQEMANATPVHRGGAMKGKPINVPDRPPPPGYICYRCGEKGHWIQVCPTNEDPTFDGRPRIKRTTGIPRSFLRVIEKPLAPTGDGTTEDIRQPSGVMVNADGEWVVAEPDRKAWDKFQERTKVSTAAQKEILLGNKELQDKGLECSIDKRMFVDPTKTPCCQKTYCNDCITNALLDDDLQCPGCGKEGILIDDLTPDTYMLVKIRTYENEKVTAKREQQEEEEKEKSPLIKQEAEGQSRGERLSSKSPEPASNSRSSSTSSKTNAKKRPAEGELENDRFAAGPNGNSPSTAEVTSSTKVLATSKPFQFPPELAFLNQPPFTDKNMAASSGMSFPNINAFMGMPGMNMPAMMNMNNAAMTNPMMMPMSNAFPMGVMPWTSMINMVPPSFNGVNGIYGGGMMPTGSFVGMNSQVPLSNNINNIAGGNDVGYSRSSTNTFTNQQRNASRPNAEDSAYFRQPVNPHRHQGRRNVPRPTDYREI